jgi:hypothetical protein
MSISIQRNPDEEHLKLLAVFHYVIAALSFLTGCTPIFHVAIGIMMLAGGMNGGPNPPPREVGWLFTCIGGSIMLFFWAAATLQIFTARSLNRHTSYGLCYTVAIIDCFVYAPMGIVLGVFTIIVLNRPSVKALFAGIEYRDPRLAAFDEITKEEEERPPASTADDAIREGPAS